MGDGPWFLSQFTERRAGLDSLEDACGRGFRNKRK